MTSQEIEISKITPGEVDLLRAISIITFTETFSKQNTEADMQKYVHDNLSSEKLSLELNTNGSEFYFLRNGGRIVGYLKLNSGAAQTEKQNGNTIEIERIYVTKEFHGKYFGNKLLQKAITVAKEGHYEYIWLAVWEHNAKAIAFYIKHGFVEFGKHTFQLGNDKQLDVMMKLELN